MGTKEVINLLESLGMACCDPWLVPEQRHLDHKEITRQAVECIRELDREVAFLREDNQFLIQTMQAAKMQIGVGDNILYRELYKRGLANE